ncbi:hypothetical protein [Streptomyces sp. UNOC14_S4]|uniref:hypothetical protein n=1 Tax=Streptomyces sp. UNOC14_S4 TaxID=2872340 RepID=UPI001E38B5A8|nr:hypothetical protein [Streptomyces sp. UNOC14_S4]MCC3767666.1 hypothetical protein [Streptomyces sp. UNOC14_S4]
MTDSDQSPLAGADGPAEDSRATGPFSVIPGGPPDVYVSRFGETGYPGVKLATDEGAIPVLNVYVALPQGKRLKFVDEGVNHYQLTVQHDKAPDPVHYPGALVQDGQAVLFKAVDLGLSEKGSKSTAWVAVKATDNASEGKTALTFCVGDQASPSTPVRVVDHIDFTVSPGGPDPVQLVRGGGPGYPGVVLGGAPGTPAPQDVYVALPEGKRLQFVDHGVTVLPALHGPTFYYPGTLSEDGQALTVPKVDLHFSGQTPAPTVFIGVKALDNGPAAETRLLFCVGDRTSPSTLIQIKEK